MTHLRLWLVIVCTTSHNEVSREQIHALCTCHSVMPTAEKRGTAPVLAVPVYVRPMITRTVAVPIPGGMIIPYRTLDVRSTTACHGPI